MPKSVLTGLKTGRFSASGNRNVIVSAGLTMLLDFANFAIDGDIPIINKLLEKAARKIGHSLAQKFIYSLTGM